jgi:MFS family permease
VPSNRDLIVLPGVDRVFDRRRILVVLLIPLAMSLLAVSSVNVALDSIEEGMGATSSDLQWVLSGYALAFGILLIPAGRLGDLRGRGAIFVLGLALFTLGSLLCGLAADPLQLNAFRLIQGLGAGLFNPQLIGMIQQYYTGGGRAKAFALFGAVVSASVAVGPLLTGFMIELLGPETGWRFSFLLNVPLGVVGIVLALRWFPFFKERVRALRRRARGGDAEAARILDLQTDPELRREVTGRLDIDPVGTVLVALSVLCLMLPFMIHQGVWRWGLLPIGALVLVAWIGWERRYKRRGHAPMVDLSLFSFRSFSYGSAAAGVWFLGATSVFVLVALYLQGGVGWSAMQTGMIGLPNAAVSGLTSMWTAKHVLTRGRQIEVAATVVMIVGLLASIGVLVAASQDLLSPWWLLLTLGGMGWGQGAFGSCNQTLTLQDVPAGFGGTAGGVKSTVERLGTAVGNAVITGIYFGVAMTADLVGGFVAGYLTIAVIMLLCFTIVVLDRRAHRSTAAAVA